MRRSRFGRFLSLCVPLLLAGGAIGARGIEALQVLHGSTVVPSATVQKEGRPTYEKTWQVARTAGQSEEVGSLSVTIPGRVFVRRAVATDLLDSETLATVTVYGSSQAVVSTMLVQPHESDAGLQLTARSTSNQRPIEGYLLTEIVFKSEGELSAIDVSGSAQVVLQEGVLARNTDTLLLRAVGDDGGSGAIIVDARASVLQMKSAQVVVSKSATVQLAVEALKTKSLSIVASGYGSAAIASTKIAVAMLSAAVANRASACFDSSFLDAQAINVIASGHSNASLLGDTATCMSQQIAESGQSAVFSGTVRCTTVRVASVGTSIARVQATTSLDLSGLQSGSVEFVGSVQRTVRPSAPTDIMVQQIDSAPADQHCNIAQVPPFEPVFVRLYDELSQRPFTLGDADDDGEEDGSPTDDELEEGGDGVGKGITNQLTGVSIPWIVGVALFVHCCCCKRRWVDKEEKETRPLLRDRNPRHDSIYV